VGGTSTRVAVIDAGGRIAVHARPSAAVADLGHFLRTLWRRNARAGRRPAVLVVASRGIWTRAERAALARRLARLADRVVVLADAQVALLGALGRRGGLLVLSGTGSIVVGRDVRGRWQRAGGLGPLLGDEGSGFWLGREWLRATAGGGHHAAALRMVRSPDAVARIAALAPRVLARARRGDRRARAIVRGGQTALAAAALAVARRLRLPAPVAVSWAGSVMGDPYYRSGVVRALARAGLRARWLTPAQPPVIAAAHLARHLAGAAHPFPAQSQPARLNRR
jgi:N-acetylglucosamine kinase-like BadF-type ATPase